MSDAYAKGFVAGHGNGTWLDCHYTGALRTDWLNGFDAGRNARAEEQK